MGFYNRSATKPVGPLTCARLLACGLAVIVAAPVWAAGSYRCEFDQECVGADRPCSSTDAMTMAFVESADGWMIKMPDGKTMGFTPLPGQSDDMRSFLSDETDPDAHAVSMLSIFSDGQAFMSTHGIFLSPGTVTHIGTCLPEGE